MKHNEKLAVTALVLALITIMVLSALGFVILQNRGGALPTTSVGTVDLTTVQVPVTTPSSQELTQQMAVAEKLPETILPAVTVTGAGRSQDLRDVLGEGISLVTPGHTYVVSADELGSWINKDGLTWNDEMIRKKVRGIAREQDREAIPTKVIGNTDQVVEEGTAGVAVDQEVAYQTIVGALLTGLTERVITIPTQVTEPARVAVSSSAAPTITTGKQIVVVLSEQRLYAWNNGKLDASYLISSGLTGPTPIGDFSIWARYPVGCMSGPGYNLCDIHWIQYFTAAGHGFHEKWWNDIYGQPSSHGCVNMTYNDSKWLYEWSTYGTPVHIVE